MPLNPATKRPVHLNLTKIRLPVGGVMSIIHRLTGVLMFVSIPLLIYLLDRSLISAQGFAEAVHLLHTPLGKLMLFGLMWSLMHHLLAGIRYLLIDGSSNTCPYWLIYLSRSDRQCSIRFRFSALSRWFSSMAQRGRTAGRG